MCEKGTVSIISPCYNVANFLPFYFDSLLKQSYRHLEVILVNDGSSDSTDEVITRWLPILESAGFKTKYLRKDNGGQSSAINEGLRHFTGEFLTWPDPDDFLYPDSIRLRVEFLKKNPNFGLVRSAADVYLEEQRDVVVGRLMSRSKDTQNLFRHLLFAKTYFAPVCYMIRSIFFLQANPSRTIYVRKDAGQNWQMLLPVAANHPCGYLPLSLCGYLRRKSSHSNRPMSLKEKLCYYDMCLDVILNTCRISSIDLSTFEKDLLIQYSAKRLQLGLEFCDKSVITLATGELRKLGGLTVGQQLVSIVSSMDLLFNRVIMPLWKLRTSCNSLIKELLEKK